MKPIKATTPRNKIRILKHLKKSIEKNTDFDGFCFELQLMQNRGIIDYDYSPEAMGLKPPKNWYDFNYWYECRNKSKRIANINRTIKRLENQIK